MCDIERCTEQKTDGRVSFKERGVSFIINNPNKIFCKKVKVDGCLPINGQRCDWALISEVQTALIELKGSDYDHAIKQIKNTLIWFHQSTKITINIGYIVIRNRIPRDTAKQQNLREKFAKETGTKIINVKSGKCLSLQDL